MENKIELIPASELPVAEGNEVDVLCVENGELKRKEGASLGGRVKTVNGIEPDENGNVEVNTGDNSSSSPSLMHVTFFRQDDGTYVCSHDYYTLETIYLSGETLLYATIHNRSNQLDDYAGYFYVTAITYPDDFRIHFVNFKTNAMIYINNLDEVYYTTK